MQFNSNPNFKNNSIKLLLSGAILLSGTSIIKPANAANQSFTNAINSIAAVHPDPIDQSRGITFDTNTDNVDPSEGFFVNDSGERVLTGQGGQATTLGNTNNVILNSNTDGNASGATQLQVNGQTGVSVNSNGAGNLGSVGINNNAGGSVTNIGTGSTTGAVNIGNTTGGTAITGATTIAGGAASINNNSNNNTNVNTGTSTGTVTVGNAASTTNVLGAANINSTGTASTNIGNVTGLTALTGTTTITSASGNSNATFNDTGTSIVADTDGNAANGRGIVNVTQNSAAVTVTNGIGNTHGLNVGTTNTVLSGGVNSTTLTLDDNGATFANTNAGGGPAQVHGVADGTARFDAVNVGQLDRAFDNVREEAQGGIATVAAMANIPQVDESKKFSLGFGYGNFKSESGYAAGGSIRFTPSLVGKASLGASTDGDVTTGAGVGYSW